MSERINPELLPGTLYLLVLRTLYAWSLGLLNTALWGTLSLAGSVFDRSGGWAHKCMVRWSRINLRLLGTRLEPSRLALEFTEGVLMRDTDATKARS